ncbi:MAG: phosphodiester glycosidase family protein, partial [Armatimonadaceae bacterium]
MFPAIALLALCAPISSDWEPILSTHAAVRPASTPVRNGRSLAPGVEFFQEVGPAGDSARPLSFSYLRIDPKSPGIRLESALAQDRVWGTDATRGRETLSRLARRRGAVAAINGGYFGTGGDPVGLNIGDGELRSEPLLNRSVLMIDNQGNADISTVSMKAVVRAGTREWVLNGINRPPVNTRQLLAFNPRFHTSTLPAEARLEWTVELSSRVLRPGKNSGKIVRSAVGGNCPIPENSLVLSAGGTLVEEMRPFLESGAAVEIDIQLATPTPARISPKDIQHAIAGAPRIVSNGRRDLRVPDEEVKPDVALGRNPRTAVGICRDGSLLLMVVDGRQESLSQGATLEELADLMISLGAVDAVNFDGGGSSTMVVEGAVVNAPSEKAGERPIADALLVFSDTIADGPHQEISLAVPQRAVKVGEQFTIALPEGF